MYSDLEIPKKLFTKVTATSSIVNFEEYIDKAVYREQDAHKGNFGHVLVVGGDRGLGGAGLLASKAAVYSGAGLTSLVTRPEHVNASLVSCPEVMVKGVNSGQDLEEHLIKPTVIAIGPGLGQTAWSEQMIQRVFWEAEKRTRDLDTPEKQADLFRRVRKRVAEIKNRNVREAYKDLIEAKIKDFRSTIRLEGGGTASRHNAARGPTGRRPPPLCRAVESSRR